MRRVVLLSLLVIAGIALARGRIRRLGHLGRLPRSPSAVALVALLLLVACGGNGSAAGGGGGSECDVDTEEALDPGSVQHLLPGAPEPVYSSDPPTSGPHLAGATPSGAQDEPVARPAQVAVLEAGGVMIQHSDVTPADRRRLRTLSERQVVVAPNPDLTSPVVATAWRHRLTCGGASGGALDALAAFVDAHQGNGPEQ